MTSTSSEERLLHEGVNNVRGEITEKEVDLDPKNARKKLEKMFLALPESTQKTLSDLPVEKDEEGALGTLETLLKEDVISFKGLQDLLWTLLRYPYGFRARTKEGHIANLTVSFLREEISVLPLGKSAPRRGLDVVRIKIAKSRQGKDGFGRIELDNPQTLMEVQDNLLADQNSRPRNYLTETVSRSIDKGESDLEILKATAKRGIIEEALEPLSAGDSSITNEQIEELAEWLLQSVNFRTKSGQDVPSGSTQVLSHYRLHTIHVDVPHPRGDSVPPRLKPLLQKLRMNKPIKRDREGNALVWVPISPRKIEPVRAPVYCHSRVDAKRMEEMQETRELDLRVIPESDNPGLDSGDLPSMKDAKKEEWLELVPAKYNKDLEAAMEAHIHEDDWEGVRDQTRNMGDPRSSLCGKKIGTGPLYNPVKATITVMCAVANYGCKDCGAKKGETCDGEKSELVEDAYNFNNASYKLKKYSFRVHRSRLLDYRGKTTTGGSQLWKELVHNIRHQEGRLETIDIVKKKQKKNENEKLEPTKLEPGAKLHQIRPKSQSGKITLELDPEVVVEYNPDRGNANSSTDGWWFQVHIDQSTDEMRKIANELVNVGYNFVLLCCPTGDQSNRALGIISVLDLNKLAKQLD